MEENEVYRNTELVQGNPDRITAVLKILHSKQKLSDK